MCAIIYSIKPIRYALVYEIKGYKMLVKKKLFEINLCMRKYNQHLIFKFKRTYTYFLNINVSVQVFKNLI